MTVPQGNFASNVTASRLKTWQALLGSFGPPWSSIDEVCRTLERRAIERDITVAAGLVDRRRVDQLRHHRRLLELDTRNRDRRL